MLNSTSLPASLVQKLARDERNLQETLAQEPADSSVKLTRDLADRALLALTPKALSTLDSALDGGLTKDRIAAATIILDRSPATRPQNQLQSDAPLLPMAAFESLLSTLGKLFQASAIPAPSQTIRMEPAHEQTVEIQAQVLETSPEASPEASPAPPVQPPEAAPRQPVRRPRNRQARS